MCSPVFGLITCLAAPKLLGVVGCTLLQELRKLLRQPFGLIRRYKKPTLRQISRQHLWRAIEQTALAVAEAARTGRIGDGKILLLDEAPVSA